MVRRQVGSRSTVHSMVEVVRNTVRSPDWAGSRQGTAAAARRIAAVIEAEISTC